MIEIDFEPEGCLGCVIFLVIFIVFLAVLTS